MGAMHRSAAWARFVLALVMLFGVALATAPGLASTTVSVGEHSAAFLGVRYDFPAPGKSTWYYQVTSSGRPPINDLALELTYPGVRIVAAGTWNGTDMAALSPGGGMPDPWNLPAIPILHSSTGVTGIAFRENLSPDQTRYYYVTVNGNYAADSITIAAHPHSATNRGLITGPSTAGALATASLGGVAWLDANRDGIRDVGEQGRAGVNVRLYGVNPGGQVHIASLVAQTTTDASGGYLFTGVMPGSYIVEFARPVHPRFRYHFSPPRRGGNSQADSDADEENGRSQIVAAGWGETILHLNAGLYTTPILPAAVTVSRWEATRENDTLRFEWTTAWEYNNLGFDLFAVVPSSGAWIRINSALIVAQGLGLEPQDYTYEVVRSDIGLEALFYLRAYDLNGTHEDLGPIQATVSGAQPPVVSPEAPAEAPAAPNPVEDAPPRRNTGMRFLRP